MKTHPVMGFLILVCLCRALGITLHGDGVYGRKKYPQWSKHNPSEADENMIRRIEEEMLALNKSGELPRDKRALGILLQGFMEALGYTVSPIQIGSLPNPTAAAQMPVPVMKPPPPPIPGMPPVLPDFGMNPVPPMGMPPLKANGTTSTPTPRQRETIRFTGVLNFGNNVNTSNLVSHLSQYEQLFHGNRSAAPPPAPAAPPPTAARPPPPSISIDPRFVPLPEPLFVKIPLPIVPNLPPPQPPSPMPIKNTYLEYHKDEDYHKDHEEEYHHGNKDTGHRGNLDEEEDSHHYNENYESNHATSDKYDQPEDRNYEYRGAEGSLEANRHNDEDDDTETFTTVAPGTTVEPQEKTTEKEYKKNENVVNYSVESKEIHDPSEVAEEVPLVGSKFNHAMYVGERNWKKEHEDQLYKLAAEQEAQAEALAEENAERDKSKDREHELSGENKEFHASREKEISDRNEEHSSSYEEDDEPREKPYYDEAEDRSEEPDKENYSSSRSSHDDEDYEQESKVLEKPLLSESSTKIPKGTTTSADPRKYETYVKPQQYKSYYENDEKKTVPPTISYTTNLPVSYDREKVGHGDNLPISYEREKIRHSDNLPISYDREMVRQGDTLRDSYGQSLERPGGKVDERVAPYITMFKNPQTGVYDPSIIQQYGGSASASYDTSDLASGFQKIQKEYGRPESKYEEYEIKDDDYSISDDSRPEHRKNSAEELKYSNKPITTTECDCSKETKKPDVHTEEASSADHVVSTSLTPPTKPTDTPGRYDPYYSTVNHVYDPLSDDQSIIARLTSYSPPTTQRFETITDMIQNPSFSTVHKQQHQTYTPTVVTLPERSTIQSTLRESGVKDIRAWPAPFDYVYDNSEHTDVIHRGTQFPTRQTPLYHSTKPDCNHQAHADKVQQMLREASNEQFDRPTRPVRRPDSHRNSRKVKINPSMRINFYPPSTTQATTWDSRKTLKHHHHLTFSTKNPETLTPHPSSLLRPPIRNPMNFNSQFFRRQDLNVRPQDDRLSGKTNTKKKQQVKDETSNYVEKDGMLIIPEPTPYYYNERIEEFTDEPLVNGEKVKVKEFRNRVASVKVSELKQLHPEGKSQIVQYSRHL